MPIWGQTFGLASASWLLALVPLTAGLIYLYLRKGRGRRRLVGTLLLLQRVTSVSSARKRFVPPLRFYFDLLVFLLLLLALAGLYRERSDRRITILLDNSLSMQAIDQGGVLGDRIIDRARKEAQRLVRELGARYDVYVTTPKLRAISEQSLAVADAAAAIAAIQPAWGVDRLAENVQRLASRGGIRELHVFSDRKLTIVPSAGSESGYQGLVRMHPLIAAVQRQRNNIGIVSIGWLGLKPGADRAKVRVEIRSFADITVPLVVKIEQFYEGLPSSDSPEQSVSLAPQESAEVVFEDLPVSGFSYRVRLASSGAASLASQDLLTIDNEAWIGGGGGLQRVALVGPLSGGELGFSLIPGLEVSSFPLTVTATQIEAVDPALIVFHRNAPASLPPIPSLFVLPSQTSGTVRTFRTIAEQAKITRWDESSPLLTYLNVTALDLTSLAPIDLPIWGRSVISTERGTAIAAGEIAGHRRVIVGFELFPYEGKAAPWLSIFTLNALKWLAGVSAAQGYRSVGSVVALEEGTVRVGRFNERPIFESAGGEQLVEEIALSEPGLYRIDYDRRPAATFAVNFFSEQESDLSSQGEVQVPISWGGAAVEDQRSSLRELLVKILAAVLVLDLIFQLFASGAHSRKATTVEQ